MLSSNTKMITLFVNGTLSSGFPSVNTAVKYLHILDQTGIVGGSPQTTKPNMKKGKQVSDTGNHSDVVIHNNIMFISADKSLGRSLSSEILLYCVKQSIITFLRYSNALCKYTFHTVRFSRVRSIQSNIMRRKYIRGACKTALILELVVHDESSVRHHVIKIFVLTDSTRLYNNSTRLYNNSTMALCGQTSF